MAILTGNGTTFTIATDDEAFSGADVNKAITPDQLLAVVSQSVAAVSGGLIYKGVFNATTLKPDLSNARQGDFYKVSVADTAYGETYAVGDMLLINADMGGTIDANKIDKIDNSEALTSLDDLTDVTLVNSNTGEVLRYNGTDWVNQEISADDLNADHTGVNYTGASTDSIETHLAGIDTALAAAGGASNLDGLSDVTITNAGAGEVLRYSGTQWVDAQLSYNDLSNTPALASSTDDLTSDHTGTNYTGANTDTVTTHLSGIDSELNNRADTVNSVAVSNGAVTIDGDDIIAPRIGTNYTAANTDSITTHLAGIDTALASAGGFSSLVVSNSAAAVAVDANTFVTLSSTNTLYPWKIKVPATPADGDAIILTIASSGGQPAASRTTIEIYASNGITLLHEINANLDRCPVFVVYESATASWLISPSVEGMDLRTATSYSLNAYRFGYVPIIIYRNGTNNPAFGLTIPSAASVLNGETQEIILRGRRDLTITSGAQDIIDPTSSAEVQTLVTGITLRADAGSVKIRRIEIGGQGRWWLDAPLANLDAIPSSSDDLTSDHTGTNYTGANTDSITTHLAGIDTALASVGASDLDGLSDVTITNAGAGEVLRYSGTQWVDAQLSYNDLSNTPALASSTDDLTSDHTGTNYTGANTDTVTTHLSGIDSELNNRADTVNSVAVANGAVTIDGDDIIAPRTATNYTAANTDSITTHLAGIDTALASVGGAGATLTVLSNTSYTLSASNAAGIHIWYGVANNSTFTVTMPDIANVLSTAASVNGVPVETFEVYVGRAQAGDITISAADGIDLLGDGSVSYSTTQTVNAGQWVKLIGWYVSGTTQRYIMDSAAQPRDAALDSISGLTTAANQLIYTTASDTYAVASLTAAGRALLDDADATAQRATLNLGSAATLNAGTGANELVQLDASSRLPAVDGSQLINLPASTSDLNGLSDVTITAAATGEVLRYSGTQWVDAPLSISDDPSPSLGGDLNLNGNGISSHLVPSTTGKDIGTSSAEWRNLYLADNSKILFGLDQDVELIHDPDDGLILDLGVADGSHDPQLELKSQTSGLFGARLTFTTESTTPASFDRVGQMRFQGKDSAGNLQDYGYIYGQIHDPTSGAEAGKISILAYPASANTRGLHVEGIAGDASGAKVNIDHNGSSYGLHLNNTLVTSTANELNLLDGGTAVGSSITIADTDGVIVNDGGTSKLVPASDLKTYIGVSSGASYTYSAITAGTTTAQAWYHYSADASGGAITVNLPALSGFTDGDEIRFKLRDATNALTINANSGETIDNSASYTLNVAYSAVTLVAGSAEWEII